MSSAYFFLVAEASAISSAPKTMSRGTFFSRASTSTSITSSLFPVVTFATVATIPSQFRHQLRALQVLERELHCLPFEFDAQVSFRRAAQHADELPPSRRV